MWIHCHYKARPAQGTTLHCVWCTCGTRVAGLVETRDMVTAVLRAVSTTGDVHVASQVVHTVMSLSKEISAPPVKGSFVPAVMTSPAFLAGRFVARQ